MYYVFNTDNFIERFSDGDHSSIMQQIIDFTRSVDTEFIVVCVDQKDVSVSSKQIRELFTLHKLKQYEVLLTDKSRELYISDYDGNCTKVMYQHYRDSTIENTIYENDGVVISQYNNYLGIVAYVFNKASLVTLSKHVAGFNNPTPYPKPAERGVIQNEHEEQVESNQTTT